MNSSSRLQAAALLAAALVSVLSAADFTVPDGTAYLAARAFAGCSRLTSVHVPTSVLGIGTTAFYGCSALTNIAVASDNTVYASRDGALYSKNLLTLIRCPGGRIGAFTVPEGVRYISERAFAGCARLTDVTLPASIITLGCDAFYHCDALTNIAVASDSTLFRTAGGVLYDTSRQPTLLRCPGGKAGDFAVPEGIWYLADHAFADCRGLTRISLPASLMGLGTNAFYHCDALTDINISGNPFFRSDGGVLYDTSRQPTLLRCPGGKAGDFAVPEGTWYLADHAFAGCRGLTRISLPASLVNVGTNTFYQCDALTDIAADDGNAIYGSIDGVLYLASRQTRLVCCPGGKAGAFAVPSGVWHIDACAFAGCARLTEVSLPSSILDIGTNAFYRCASLTSITSASSLYTSSDGLLYSSSRLPTLLRCPGGKAGTVTIPEGTWSIAPRAFARCGRITEARLPSNTFTLGAEAFYRCTSLTNIAVDASNAGYASAGGVLYTRSPLPTLVCCPAGWGGTDTVGIGGVSVPCAWLDRYGLAPGGDYTAAAASDTDGDGYPAWQEYVAGTDPTNAL
jgi:hypothetical protein